MALTKQEYVLELARLSGVPVPETLAAEVGDRLDSLLRELERLNTLDLTGIEPSPIFPELDADDQ